jgi:hypothetical protein
MNAPRRKPSRTLDGLKSATYKDERIADSSLHKWSKKCEKTLGQWVQYLLVNRICQAQTVRRVLSIERSLFGDRRDACTGGPGVGFDSGSRC